MISIKKPFATIMQNIVIAFLIISMILVAQRISFQIYKVGLVMLTLFVILQIGFGNIPFKANFVKSMALLGLILLIIISVFSLGILVVPLFVRFVTGG